jgi:hypothetical protein
MGRQVFFGSSNLRNAVLPVVSLAQLMVELKEP